MGGYVGLGRTAFAYILYREGVMVLKGLTFDSSVCDGIEVNNFVWMSLWKGVVLFKGLIFSNFHFLRIQQPVLLYSGDGLEMSGYRMVALGGRDPPCLLLMSPKAELFDSVDFCLGRQS